MHQPHDPTAPIAPTITFGDCLQVDIRVGTIHTAKNFPKTREPDFILTIDFLHCDSRAWELLWKWQDVKLAFSKFRHSLRA